MLSGPLFYMALAACLAVLGVLAFGIAGFGRGGEDRGKKSNRLMQWRIGLQLLAVLLIVGGVVGAQIGTSLGARLRAEQLRIMLALLVLAVCGKLALDLFLPPEDLYSIVVRAR